MRARRLTAFLPLLAACAAGPTWSGVPAVSPRADPIVAAFHVNWDPESRRSLLALRDRLDWIIAEWAFLADAPDDPVRLETDTSLARLLAADARGPRIVLMVSNAQDAGFDGARVARLLAAPRRRDAAIAALVTAAEKVGAVGLLLDFEALAADQHEAVLAFAADLRMRLAARGRLLLIAVPVGDADWPMTRYAAAADLLVPMLYDEHHPGGPAGPVAAHRWFEAELARLTAVVPPHRLLPGIATYGYLWRDSIAEPIGYAAGQDSARRAAAQPEIGRVAGRSAPVPEAGARMEEAGDRNTPLDGVVRRDSASGALVARWRGTSGETSTLWQSDRVTVLTQAAIARRLMTAGVALWRLGVEDPALRPQLARRRLPVVATP